MGLFKLPLTNLYHVMSITVLVRSSFVLHRNGRNQPRPDQSKYDVIINYDPEPPCGRLSSDLAVQASAALL